jgi:hypothetical protein
MIERPSLHLDKRLLDLLPRHQPIPLCGLLVRLLLLLLVDLDDLAKLLQPLAEDLLEIRRDLRDCGIQLERLRSIDSASRGQELFAVVHE